MRQEDAIRLLRSTYKRLPFKVVFDVGANCGQTSAAFLRYFPDAAIHAFEPSSASHAALLAAVGGSGRVTCHRVALGAEAGAVHFTTFGTSVSNAIVADSASVATEVVRRETGDVFCAAQDIGRIGYLKIDTEGHDLEVLRGFTRMLAEQRIDALEVEAGMHHHNDKHVPLSDFMAFLAPLGYFVFQFYEQAFERHGRAHLRRVNALFVSDRAVRSNEPGSAADKRFPVYGVAGDAGTEPAPVFVVEMPQPLHLPDLPGGVRLRLLLRSGPAVQSGHARLSLRWTHDDGGRLPLVQHQVTPTLTPSADGTIFEAVAPTAGLPVGPLRLEIALQQASVPPMAEVALSVTRHSFAEAPGDILRNAEWLHALRLCDLPEQPRTSLGAAAIRALSDDTLLMIEPPRDISGALATGADIAAMEVVSPHAERRRWRSAGYRAAGLSVAVLRDAHGFGTCTAVSTASGLYGEVIHFGTRRPWLTRLQAGLGSLRDDALEVLDEAALVANEGTHLYYHWHVNCLASATAMLELETAAGLGTVPFLVRPLSRWQADSLALLGVAPERLRTLPPRRWRVGRLFVPSPLTEGTDAPDAALLRCFARLRAAAERGGPASASRPQPIYVSRLDAPSRRPMQNEAELVEALRSAGAYIFDARDHAYANQVRLFAEARIIIGPHGAGLVNMGFAMPGALVVELFPAHDQPQYFARLALLCGHRYRACTAPRRPDKQHEKGAWRADVASVLRFVEDAIAEAS